MSTNFLERQDSAKRSTGWLILMFALATAAVVATIMVAVTIALVVSHSDNAQSLTSPNFPWPIPVFAGLATLALILGGSFFRIVQLQKGGGAMVAESQGGVRIYPNTRDPVQRRVLNVVEEMAIAAGTTVPPVYFLPNEPGINAFAAGYSPSDAVVAVTRGATEELTRDELQGVIAHEFSHILNSDMKIGIRLIGVLYGILLLGLVGQIVLRMTAYSNMGSRRNSKSNGLMMAIFVIALAAIVLGFVGTFLGNLIKAAVSRQRERLADASGVQFTRNPAGLAGALKRIGALEYGSVMHSPNAAEASHLFFAEGLRTTLAGLWATHPPLPERIRELDPSWNGVFPPAHAGADKISRELSSPPSRTQFDATAFSSQPKMDFAGGSPKSSEIPIPVVNSATEHIGSLTQQHCDYAETIVGETHPDLVAAAREPYSARAVVFCMLLHKNSEIRHQQLTALDRLIEPALARVVRRLMPQVDEVETRARLPLIDLTLPALAAMTEGQYSHFSKAFNEMVGADGQLDLFEWMLAQTIRRNLQARFERVRPPAGRYRLRRFPKQCATVFSTVAYAGNSDEQASQSFAAAQQIIPELPSNSLSREMSGLKQLQAALVDLESATVSERIRLIRGCAAAISADRHATIEEVELLRGISDLLGCPMPPLLAD